METKKCVYVVSESTSRGRTEFSSNWNFHLTWMNQRPEVTSTSTRKRLARHKKVKLQLPSSLDFCYKNRGSRLLTSSMNSGATKFYTW